MQKKIKSEKEIPNTFSDFEKKYKNNDININFSKNLCSFIKKNDDEIDITCDEIDKDWEYLSSRILAEIANAKWGRKYFYKITALKNIQIRKALKYFDEYDNLLIK